MLSRHDGPPHVAAPPGSSPLASLLSHFTTVSLCHRGKKLLGCPFISCKSEFSVAHLVLVPPMEFYEHEAKRF